MPKIPQWGTYGNNKMRPTGVLAPYAHMGHLGWMLPNNITALRKRRKLTQAQLAEAIGTKLTMLGKLERGERKLTDAWLQKLARALAVEPHEIIGPLADGDLIARPSLPRESTLVEMLRAAAPALSAARASEELFLTLAHKFAVVSRAVEEKPEIETDPKDLRTLLLGVFLDTGHSQLDRSLSG